jgi:hypothetical protein
VVRAFRWTVPSNPLRPTERHGPAKVHASERTNFIRTGCIARGATLGPCTKLSNGNSMTGSTIAIIV